MATTPGGAVATIPTAPVPAGPVAAPYGKQVAHESAPVVSAVTIAGTMADCWQLLVDHLHWWTLPNSLWVGLGAALFFLFRSFAKTWHVRAARRRERRDRAYLLQLVRAGVVLPIPSGSPVVELPPPPAPPAMPAGG